MKKRECRASGLFALPVIAVAIIAAILTSAVLINDYDASIRHFTAGTGKLIAAFLPLAAGAVLTVAAFLLADKKPIPERIAFSGTLPTFAAAFLGFILLASAVFDFMNASSVAATVPAVRVGTYTMLLRVRAVFSVLSVPYFVLIVLGDKEKQHPAARYAPLPLVLWAVLTTVTQYFNGRMPINDPVMTLILLNSVALIGFAVAENRLRFRRGTYRSVAALLTLTGTFGGIALSELFFSLRESISGKTNIFGFTVMEATLYVAVLLFALARLSSLGETIPAPTEEQSA